MHFGHFGGELGGGESQVMSLWSELSPLRDQTRADRVLCTIRKSGMGLCRPKYAESATSGSRSCVISSFPVDVGPQIRPQ